VTLSIYLNIRQFLGDSFTSFLTPCGIYYPSITWD